MTARHGIQRHGLSSTHKIPFTLMIGNLLNLLLSFYTFAIFLSSSSESLAIIMDTG